MEPTSKKNGNLWRNPPRSGAALMPLSRARGPLVFLGMVLLFCRFASAEVLAVERAEDPVSSFKKILSSSLHLRHIVSVQTNAISGLARDNERAVPVSVIVGSFSSSNFVVSIRSIEECTEPPSPTLSPKGASCIFGRSGSSTYVMTANALRTNPAPPHAFATEFPIGVIEGCERLLHQIASLGCGDLDLGTIVWNGHRFEADGRQGRVYGSLTVSNGIPAKLELATTRTGTPFRTCSYVYPQTLMSLDGYPQLMRLTSPLESPVDVRIVAAAQSLTPIPASHYDVNRYIGSNIVFRNHEVFEPSN